MKKKGSPATGWHFWGSDFFTLTSPNLVRMERIALKTYIKFKKTELVDI